MTRWKLTFVFALLLPSTPEGAIAQQKCFEEKGFGGTLVTLGRCSADAPINTASSGPIVITRHTHFGRGSLLGQPAKRNAGPKCDGNGTLESHEAKCCWGRVHIPKDATVCSIRYYRNGNEIFRDQVAGNTHEEVHARTGRAKTKIQGDERTIRVEFKSWNRDRDLEFSFQVDYQ